MRFYRFVIQAIALIMVFAISMSVLSGCSNNTGVGPVNNQGSSSVPVASIAPTINPNDNSSQSYLYGKPGQLNSIGHCTPDRIYDLDPEVDAEEAAAETLKVLQAIDAEDMRLVEELREGYKEKTVAEFRADFNRQVEKSAGFFGAVSELTHAGIHNMYMDMDDFYCSLYFALLNWCKHYGPESIRDTSYSFSYWRYFGEKQEVYSHESWDMLKLVYFGYALDIIYEDDTAITVGERDSAIVEMIGEINDTLYTFTYSEWHEAEAESRLYDLLYSALEKHSTEAVTFKLLQIDYLSGNEIEG